MASRRLDRLRLPVPRATWTLIDQAILSIGTFLLGIVLARHISLDAYGHYALFLGVLGLMNAGTGSLIFYPMTVHATVMGARERAGLVLSTLLLTLVFCAGLAVLLGLVIWRFVDPALLVPATCVFFAGQLQEATRRGLLSAFRHRDAIVGDAISFLGQLAVLFALMQVTPLDLAMALYAISFTSLLGACVQVAQLGLAGATPAPIARTLRDFWSLGRWSLGSNILLVARGAVLPWLLAALSGPAAAGVFQLVMNIVNVMNPVTIGLSNVIPQAAARAKAEGTGSALRQAWPYMAAGLPIVGLMTLLIIAVPDLIAHLVYGEAIPDPQAVAALRIMAIAGLFGYVAAASCAYLYGTGDGRTAMIGDVATSLAALVPVYPLVLAYGLAGACLAGALAMVVRAAWMIAIIARRLIAERRGAAAGCSRAPVRSEPAAELPA
ncbi:hypothetical protein U0C82_06500 [Fulvimarina sp. 2208YS6-2-32]|uniref:Membrane protein involved in the export of O-antigen and teichoic acid n=1 Tax=Fulvimarina uroteuthidis TaxID=3098149 RepID=A0ABU5I086_9HYPH|nr:hypothetical protein [Fulvimarina sp. 2208YS6-2-32]MDY8108794.1 hypothetical protein [Fulvimarina sp. 2208YS6-2-32]